jgi:drug/metabolite transporter (DMT)-like permease
MEKPHIGMKDVETKLPVAVIVGLILAVVLDTVIQITWKMAVAGVPGGVSFAVATVGVLSSPFFYVAMLAFGAQLWNWLRVLARADLSFAQPFTALSYITVFGLSSRWLHERITPAKGIGVSLILVGVFFISRTPFRTRRTDGSGHQAVDPLHP